MPWAHENGKWVCRCCDCGVVKKYGGTRCMPCFDKFSRQNTEQRITKKIESKISNNERYLKKKNFVFKRNFAGNKFDAMTKAVSLEEKNFYGDEGFALEQSEIDSFDPLDFYMAYEAIKMRLVGAGNFRKKEQEIFDRILEIFGAQ